MHLDGVFAETPNGIKAPQEIEEMRLDRREVEPGALEETQRRGPNAGRADGALYGEPLALHLAHLHRIFCGRH